MERLRRTARRDEGFGLPEVMLAMLILAIIMIAMAGVLIQALNVVAKNNTRATATELATQRVEDVRKESFTGSCNNVTTKLLSSSSFTDGRGVPLTVVGEVVPTAGRQDCSSQISPDSDPQLIRVKVTVTTTQAGFTNPVATIQTDIYVKKNTS